MHKNFCAVIVVVVVFLELAVWLARGWPSVRLADRTRAPLFFHTGTGGGGSVAGLPPVLFV